MEKLTEKEMNARVNKIFFLADIIEQYEQELHIYGGYAFTFKYHCKGIVKHAKALSTYVGKTIRESDADPYMATADELREKVDKIFELMKD